MLEADGHRLRQYFAKQIEQVAAASDRVNDPQDMAEKIYECATQDTPIHNPVGSDASMLARMIAAAESRQAFIEQVTPLLMPSGQ
ncbi:MAG: hypothetical protein AAGG51_07825 [Cyanobacteria bacterium P01_G01_bin.54]